MSTEPVSHSTSDPASGARGAVPRRSPRHWSVRVSAAAGGLLLFYVLGAYLAAPLFWTEYARRHPALTRLPYVTNTKTGVPGDPINVALVGTQADVMRAMVAAGWSPADPLTLSSCLEIAEASVLKRPYETAPVSNLFFWGRKQDLAFEQPVGNNPRQRHHVRFWKSDETDRYGRPLWAGAAIFDRRVELSRRTGQITHQTDGNVDAERDYLLHDLQKTGLVSGTAVVNGFHKTRTGHNGGGDPWHTDGRLFVAVIVPPNSPLPGPRPE